MKTVTFKSLLAAAILAGLLAAVPASAGYMGFSARSLQTEDTSGC